MDDPKISYVVETGAILGESPVWSVAEQALWWVDIKAPAVHRFDPSTGRDEAWPVGQEIGSIALRRGGGLIGALRGGFARLAPGRAAPEWIVNPEPDRPLNRLNDGRTDRQGRFWAGSMHDPEGPPSHYFEREPVGALWRLDPDGRAHRMLDGIMVSNSLCFSPDGRVMYFADSRRRTIWAFDLDAATGAIDNRRVFVEVPEAPGRGTPDGSIVDAEGCLWNAEFRGARLVRYAPDGSVDRMISLPVSRPTCPMFGGPDLRTLFVTSAAIMLTPEERAAEPLAGALLALDAGVAGLPEAAFPG